MHALAVVLFLLSKSFGSDVAFEESVGVKELGSDFICHHDLDSERYDLYQAVWEKNRERSQKGLGKIPKIIHQLWLTDAPLGKEEKQHQESWTALHPKWQYKLWTLEEVRRLPEDVQSAILQAESVREKEDLLRLYILENEGGLVVDSDFECVAPFDALHESYDFYASLEAPLPKAAFGRRLHVATSIIGAVPHHPIITAWREDFTTLLATGQTNSHPVERCIKHPEKHLWLTYLLFGEAVDKKLDSSEFVNIILPPTYTFPVNARWAKGYEKRQKKIEKSLVSKVKKAFCLYRSEPFSEIQPESLAWHTNGGTFGSGTFGASREHKNK